MLKSLKFKIPSQCIFLGIVLFAFLLRVYGINWDQNQHLHPDERFLTMVTQDLKWPSYFLDYFNSRFSTLNPNSVGYTFFVYGTLPLVLTKIFAGWIQIDKFDYNNITLVGRFISGVFDLGTLFFVYKIAEKIFNKKVALIASFIYGVSALPIQLSHFFAVDTFLVFFITSSFYFLILFLENKKPVRYSILAGILLGLALSCKISALLFLPIIGISFLFFLIKYKNLKLSAFYFLLFALLSYFSFRLADPHTFTGYNIFIPRLNPVFVQNLKQLESFDNPNNLYPPAVQWITTKPIIFPLKNMVLWGLGLPLGILTLLAILYSFWTIISNLKLKILFKSSFKYFGNIEVEKYEYLLIILWITFLFIYEGIQFSKTMRYIYPIYPFLAITTAYFICQCSSKLDQKYRNKYCIEFLGFLVFLSIIIWPISFIQIYSRPHSRVSASEWIYENIPNSSTLSCEYWDDCLPLTIDSRTSSQYKFEALDLYSPDTKLKWDFINGQLAHVDYLIMSSNRLWGSIPKVPEKYPITSKFYNDLFEEKANFTLIAKFVSFPKIPLLNISINDSSSEEAFTVYDHPEVYIFRKNN
jgi:hypothetical protein